MAEDRFDGKKLSDLGFDAERISALQSHVKDAGKNHGAFGYSANTEHHFKELDNPTSKGSIEADMRKIGEHLGYKHAGTLNHDKVRDFIMGAEADKEKKKDPLKNVEMSERLATARARAAQYEEDRVSGQAAKDLYDPDNHSAEGFLERYKMKLGERLESGNYLTPDHSSTNSSKVASGENDVSMDASEFSRTGKDNREGY